MNSHIKWYVELGTWNLEIWPRTWIINVGPILNTSYILITIMLYFQVKILIVSLPGKKKKPNKKGGNPNKKRVETQCVENKIGEIVAR